MQIPSRKFHANRLLPIRLSEPPSLPHRRPKKTPVIELDHDGVMFNTHASTTRSTTPETTNISGLQMYGDEMYVPRGRYSLMKRSHLRNRRTQMSRAPPRRPRKCRHSEMLLLISSMTLMTMLSSLSPGLCREVEMNGVINSLVLSFINKQDQMHYDCKSRAASNALM